MDGGTPAEWITDDPKAILYLIEEATKAAEHEGISIEEIAEKSAACLR
ncbi:hypothetical protein [Mesorhizobium sp. WSM3860]|nr:hypothetical protein [Mesorhizobium sp. WSM3860]